jgi:hypothetical protein
MFSFPLVIVLFLVLTLSASALLSRPFRSYSRVSSSSKSSLSMSSPFMDAIPSAMSKAMMFLSDTSVSEEEIIGITGKVSELPNPGYIVGFAAVILLGTGILQFSLGDLTKEVIKPYGFRLGRLIEVGITD